MSLTPQPRVDPMMMMGGKKLVKVDKFLKPSAFMAAEYAYAVFSATLPIDWTIEDALKPECWAHVAHLLAKTPVTGEPDKAGAIIEVRTVDHAFYARLYVRAVKDRGLIVELIGDPVSFGPKEVKYDDFEPRWNIGKRGYDIIRKSDRAIVGDAANIKTREEAVEWITETTGKH